MKNQWKYNQLLTLALCCIIGCGTGDTSKQHKKTGPVSVVCTTNVVKDLVRQVGGDRIVVTAIMDGPGIDPHTYVTTPRDTNALTAADLVVYSGLHLEGQFDESLESLQNRGIPVICVTGDLRAESPSRLIQSEEGSADPHVWFDPSLWGSCAESVARQLAEHDPDGRETYEANGAAFAQQMAETLEAGRKALAEIPEDRRVLVTAHDAFAYFARAFDFNVEAVQGISTEGEPGLRRINQLIDLLTQKKIAAVFTEQSVSDKNINALIEGCAGKGHKLTIGGSLFSDTVGAEGTEQETLSGALMHNISEIAAALGNSEGAE